jgi:hypothetical protein
MGTEAEKQEDFGRVFIEEVGRKPVTGDDNRLSKLIPIRPFNMPSSTTPIHERIEAIREASNATPEEVREAMRELRRQDYENNERRQKRRKLFRNVIATGLIAGIALGTGTGIYTVSQSPIVSGFKLGYESSKKDVIREYDNKLQDAQKKYDSDLRKAQDDFAKKSAELDSQKASLKQTEETIRKKYLSPLETLTETHPVELTKTERELYVTGTIGREFDENIFEGGKVFYDNSNLANGEIRVVGKIVHSDKVKSAYGDKVNTEKNSYMIILKMDKVGVVEAQVYDIKKAEDVVEAFKDANPVRSIILTGKETQVVDFASNSVRQVNGGRTNYVSGEIGKYLVHSQKVFQELLQLHSRGPNLENASKTEK